MYELNIFISIKGARILSDIKNSVTSNPIETSSRLTVISSKRTPIESLKIAFLTKKLVYNDNTSDSTSFALRVQAFTKKIINRKRLLGKVLGVVVVFLFLINIHFLLFLKVKKNTNMNENTFLKKNKSYQNLTHTSREHFICSAELDSWYANFMDKTWFWVDVFVYFVIPFMTMCFTFSIIKFKLKSINRNYATILLDRTYNNYNKRIYLRKIRRNKKIIYIIFATNAYFCLSIVPFLIFSIMKNLNCYLSSKEFFYVKSLVEILFYSNNAFNFVFYGLTSKEYRKALKRMFSFDKKTQTKTKSSKKPIQVKRNLFCKKTN